MSTHVEPVMAANLDMARAVFRNALMHHYIDGIVAGDDVETWLKTHGGWFPDEQADYGYGGLMPVAPEAKDIAKAMEDAKRLMDRLSKTLGEDENADVLREVRDWLQGASGGASSSNLTEANLEARDFRLEFAHETLQSFKRDRSRSPRRFDDWDAKAAALQLDIKDARIDNLKESVQSLRDTIQSLKVIVQEKDTLIENARNEDVIKKAKIDALGDIVQTKDACIANLEVQLNIKERAVEIMHELISEHCRRAVSRASAAEQGR